MITFQTGIREYHGPLSNSYVHCLSGLTFVYDKCTYDPCRQMAPRIRRYKSKRLRKKYIDKIFAEPIQKDMYNYYHVMRVSDALSQEKFSSFDYLAEQRRKLHGNTNKNRCDGC